MSWNYRVIRKEIFGEEHYVIHSVYYDKDGNIQSWSADPSVPMGETLEELKDDLEKMLYGITDREIIDKKTLDEIEAKHANTNNKNNKN